MGSNVSSQPWCVDFADILEGHLSLVAGENVSFLLAELLVSSQAGVVLVLASVVVLDGGVNN